MVQKGILAGVSTPLYDVKLTKKKWVFPYDKYIEYGPEDEWWARKQGFGYEAEQVICVKDVIVKSASCERCSLEVVLQTVDYKAYEDLYLSMQM